MLKFGSLCIKFQHNIQTIVGLVTNSSIMQFRLHLINENVIKVAHIICIIL